MWIPLNGQVMCMLTNMFYLLGYIFFFLRLFDQNLQMSRKCGMVFVLLLVTFCSFVCYFLFCFCFLFLFFLFSFCFVFLFDNGGLINHHCSIRFWKCPVSVICFFVLLLVVLCYYGGLVNHHCLNSLFIICLKYYFK